MPIALHYPYSVKVLEKSTGRLVAIRTMSVGHRDSTFTWEPSPFDESRMSKKMMKMERVNFWKRVDPTGSLVVAEHQRKGIAKKMLELFLDFDQLRAEFYCSEEDEEVIFRFIFFIIIFGDRIGPRR